MDKSAVTDCVGKDELCRVLRSTLDAIPPERRGSEWLKASLFINCLFRHSGNDTFRQLQQFREQSQEAAFDEFTDKLFAVLDPLTLGPHGFNMSMKGRDSNSNWEAIAGAGLMFEELGYDWFINSGTLLGAVRENGFISHDDDVDLAVILPGDDVEAIVASWLRLKQAVRDRSMLAEWGANNQNHVHFKVKAKFGLDIFPSWILGDRVYVWPHTHGEIGREDLLPLGLRSMGGVAVKLPAVPEKMLELNYGLDWRKPNVAWRFDWQGAWKRFKEFRSALRAAEKAEAI